MGDRECSTSDNAAAAYGWSTLMLGLPERLDMVRARSSVSLPEWGKIHITNNTDFVIQMSLYRCRVRVFVTCCYRLVQLVKPTHPPARDDGG
jgi:hypothetical protein